MDDEFPREERRKDYECNVILSAASDEESRETFLARLRSAIAEEGGELIDVAHPKTLALAYPIRRERQGVLVTLVFRGASTMPNRLADRLRHERILLRRLIVERQKPRLSTAPSLAERRTEEETPASV